MKCVWERASEGAHGNSTKRLTIKLDHWLVGNIISRYLSRRGLASQILILDRKKDRVQSILQEFMSYSLPFTGRLFFLIMF